MVGVLGLPGFTLAFSGGGLAALGWGMVLAGAGLAWIDALNARSRLDGVRVALPGTVRVVRGRPFDLEVEVEVPENGVRRLRLGLMLGREFAGTDREIDAPLDPAMRSETVRWPMVARFRGRWEYGTLYLEARSRWGLWARRRSDAVALEIRAYPDMRGERRGLSALFLNRGTVGGHARRQVGKGREFEQLREYAPGDDYADIFWKGTARRGFPMTKMFQIERTQEVYVVVDHSRLSAREIPTADHAGITTQLERFLQAALALGLVAERQGDLFGVASFAERVDRFIRARNGKAHYDVCRDALYNLQPRMVSPDFEELVVFLRTRLTRRALIVVLTDLGDALTAESFAEDIRLVARQHVVLAVALKPAVARPVFAGGPAASVGEIYDRLGGQLQWDALSEVGKVLGKSGVQFVMPEHDDLTGDIVARYLNVKQRQLI
ncbi:hypothetical protein BH23VER1_BH23VER1_07800 [soil metagenome]